MKKPKRHFNCSPFEPLNFQSLVTRPLNLHIESSVRTASGFATGGGSEEVLSHSGLCVQLPSGEFRLPVNQLLLSTGSSSDRAARFKALLRYVVSRHGV